MPINPKVIREVFDNSLAIFLEREQQELADGVNERNYCARWACYMERCSEAHGLIGYVADTEHNRKQDGRIKTILGGQSEVISINCDLILHSRGKYIEEDNLIAVELKKHHRPPIEKDKDRARLIALTKASYGGVWKINPNTPPEHVCGYVLGAYVEVDRKQRICLVEFYANGNFVESIIRYF